MGAWHPQNFWTVLSGTRWFWQFWYIMLYFTLNIWGFTSDWHPLFQILNSSPGLGLAENTTRHSSFLEFFWPTSVNTKTQFFEPTLESFLQIYPKDDNFLKKSMSSNRQNPDIGLVRKEIAHSCMFAFTDLGIAWLVGWVEKKIAP